jgi:hypothetical protein
MLNKFKGTHFVQIVDHHNYTFTTLKVRNMSKADVAKMIVGFRFFENNYAHPKVDAYDGYDTPTLKPTIPNQDCQIYYWGFNSMCYEYLDYGTRKGTWLHLTTNMEAHPHNMKSPHLYTECASGTEDSI